MSITHLALCICSNSSIPTCRICKKRHFVKHCPQFQRMTAIQRRDVIREKGFCFNCLCTAHQRNFCPSRNKCMVCQKNHHTMVHVDTPQQQPPSVQSSTPRNRRSSNVSRQIQSVPNRRSRQSHLHERLSRRLHTHVFVPTALARVVTSNGPEKVRLLLSTGEAQTTILKGLVDRLKLRTTTRENMKYCTINLESYYDPQVKIQINALVQPRFHNNLPKPTTEPSLKAIYNHINELADPNFYNPVNIEIIIANDLLPGILRAGMIRTSSNMPILQSSIFGWLISGACRYQRCSPARRAAC
ncbi:uncharacterized protein LOC142225292 [Haematobia irritans]|uniref:uncharacterized protein LOC142225292 n=1 Tax=Haematobia irritans TaxID=7368 RepID=UPI003F50AC8E